MLQELLYCCGTANPGPTSATVVSAPKPGPSVSFGVPGTARMIARFGAGPMLCGRIGPDRQLPGRYNGPLEAASL